MAAAEGKKGKKAKEPAAPAAPFVNPTPVGEKKDLSGGIAGIALAYDPIAVEASWDAWWRAQGYYTADADDTEKPKYVIMLPPPNVTGALHIGHALTNAVQDTIARWRRMSGYNVLWLPGTDHAGIATQVVVEKKLKKDRNVTRHDLGREAFIEEVWKWKQDYGNRIFSQLQRMGSSLDWTREAFTMDENLSAAVKEAFMRMHESGIIYRGARLVNWDCALKSAVSDLEVDNITLDKPTRLHVPGYEKTVEFGTLTHFSYQVEGSDEKLTIATTRVETMLGDTAVAVHPDDPRYKHLHGKFCRHPFVDRVFPIITDSELVDMEFGTGAVKITPAHDPNDFATGQRHNLEFINIFTDDGLINEKGGKFAGMRRFDARKAIVDALTEVGLFVEITPNPGMRLPLCSRTKDVIEPMIKPQWWMDCKDLATRACAAVRDGELRILPEFHHATWFRFLENIREWCISRQLWWGHRIPAYYVLEEGATERKIPKDETNDRWIVAQSMEEAIEKAAAKFPAIPKDKLVLLQDEDVLDTWFSSGLFPFSTLGWPNTEAKDFKQFFPNQLLETGHDILFFWVARMVMMSLQLTDKLPFNTVYLHAMVRDAHGRKMSKALGNVIDPIDVVEGIELKALQERLTQGNLDPKEVEKAQKGQQKDYPNGIPQCGTDALRFALCDYTGQGRDINLDVLRVEGYRHLCNKIWNGTRFAMMNLEDSFKPTPLPPSSELSFPDRWILSRLDAAIQAVTNGMETFEFSEATKGIYSFFYYDFCDVYVELTKPLLNVDVSVPENAAARVKTQNTLYICLDAILKLFHPFMPFVTEELWQRLPRKEGDTPALMIAPWPKPLGRTDQPSEDAMKLTMDTVKTVRSMRDAYGLKPSARPTLFILGRTAFVRDTLTAHTAEVAQLSNAGEITVLPEGAGEPAGCGMRPVGDSCEIHLQLKGMVDIEKELKNMEKKADLVSKSIKKLQDKAAAPTYTTKVPEKVREEETAKLAAYEVELAAVTKSIEAFKLLRD